jgi:NAD+ synthase (glutamine-hydrolysing)
MKLIKAAAAALNQTPLAWEQNKANILGAIAQARHEAVSLLCLPELCITGYGCEDAFHSAGVSRMALRVLGEIVPETKGMIAAIGLPVLHGDALYNAVCLAVDGRIAGFAAKRFLAGEGLHYEPRWFKAWPEGKQSEIRVEGRAYPFGDVYFDCGEVKIGFEICEDAWVASRPAAAQAFKGVDIILNPSASHFAFGKHEVRKRLVLESSRAFGVTYVYANLLGNEAGRVIYDGDTLIGSAGKLAACGPRFSFADFRVTAAVIDIETARMGRARAAGYAPMAKHKRRECVREPFTFPPAKPQAHPSESRAGVSPAFSQSRAGVSPASSQSRAGVSPASSQSRAGVSPAFSQGEPWEKSDHLKEEEFARAIMLGLFDYMRKSRSKGFVVSLSGGVDSSAVSCLVALMVERGVKELGLRKFAKKAGIELPKDGGAESLDPVRSAGFSPLAHGRGESLDPVRSAGFSPSVRGPAESLDSVRSAGFSPSVRGPAESLDPVRNAGFSPLVRSLLTCVYQSTSNSSAVTRDAAREVAEAIGAEFLVFGVQNLVKKYVDMVGQGIGRKLTWEKDDLALQNIQARVRAPGVWLIANLRGALLLATSNRSEAAVGYATMDGDTCGGLSPIAGIDKAYLRKWLVWLEKEGPEGLHPIPALAAVNAQQPTAELRPPGASQTDEKDLMPYEVLDVIERAAIRDKLTPLEVLQTITPRFPQFTQKDLLLWVERFFRLWSRNQWKRERYAPSFHLDDENLDPKTWCRFPILSGGFEKELEELRASVEDK